MREIDELWGYLSSCSGTKSLKYSKSVYISILLILIFPFFLFVCMSLVIVCLANVSSSAGVV